MLIDWPASFGRWLDELEEEDEDAFVLATALLEELQDLPNRPKEDSAFIKRVRQARRHELWRLAHPFVPGIAVRIVVWFPSIDRAVVALVGFDKSAIGDVWYASAAARAEAIVDQWLRGSKEGRA